MNFLAHLYLSGESDDVKVGNFIGDYVKGNKYLNYRDDVKRGIILHRQIDHFTDTHPIIKESAQILKPTYKRYSGILVDLYFDHFLAKNWENYSIHKLSFYTKAIHAVLLKNYLVLPSQVRQFLPFLISNKRLQSYATIDGIVKAIEIMSNYTSLPALNGMAQRLLEDNYHNLNNYFEDFMTEIIQFVESEYQIEIKRPELQNRK